MLIVKNFTVARCGVQCCAIIAVRIANPSRRFCAKHYNFVIFHITPLRRDIINSLTAVEIAAQIFGVCQSQYFLYF